MAGRLIEIVLIGGDEVYCTQRIPGRVVVSSAATKGLNVIA